MRWKLLIAVLAASPLHGQAAPSIVEIPISIDLATIQSRIEPSVPKVIGTLERHTPDRSGRWASRFRIDRGPLELGIVDGILESTAAIQYGVEACGILRKKLIAGEKRLFPCASCGVGEPRRSAVLTLRSDITASADWRLRVVTRPAEPRFLKRCTVTMFGFDVTDRLVAPQLKAQLVKIAAEIDRAALSSTILRSDATRIWGELQKPIRAGSGRWILLAPSAPALSTLGGDGRIARLTLAVTLQPRVVRSVESPASALRPLPALGSRAGSGKGFRTTFDLDVALTEVQQQLQSQIAGKAWRIGDRQVDVSSTSLSVLGDKVAISMNVKFVHALLRTYQGRIVITGQPAYDAATRSVVLRNLDYVLEPEKRKLLFATADRLAHDGLRDAIQKSARWSIAAEEDRLRSDLDQALDRDLGSGARMRGTIDAVRPLSITASDGQLRIVAVAEGTVRVAVRN